MITDNTATAPQVADMNALFLEWQRQNGGGFQAFLRFMTRPSVRRDAFLARWSPEVTFMGDVTALTY